MPEEVKKMTVSGCWFSLLPVLGWLMIAFGLLALMANSIAAGDDLLTITVGLVSLICGGVLLISRMLWSILSVILRDTFLGLRGFYRIFFRK